VSLRVRTCDITTARVGVARMHRHHRPPIQGIQAWEATVNGWPVGWAIVGRPVSRVLQSRGWLEVTRVVTDGTRNACSLLYGAAARWARKRGTPLTTYTLASESGSSLRGAGWVVVGHTKGRQWSVPSRPRRANATEDKVRWAPPWAVELAAVAEAA
jgi:hypothetical protein